MGAKRKMVNVVTKIVPAKINIYNIFQQCLVQGSAGIVFYLIGYYEFSLLWILVPIVGFTVRSALKDRAKQKCNFIRNLNNFGEKEVIGCISDLPPWVYFPDFESADWFNQIIKRMWPFVNHYAKDYLVDYYQSWLAEIMDGYQLKGFKFERIVLGSQPIYIGGIKVLPYDRERDQITLDLDIKYAGDCNITFHLAKMKFGIRNFQLYGSLRVVLKPFISSMPLVGGIQAYFLENPTIDYDLFGAAQVGEIPGINEIIKKTIVNSINYTMVLPNKYTYQLSNEVAPSTYLEIPEGCLRVHLIKANNLERKDIKLIGKGKSDPYAVLRVGAEEHRSKVIDSDINPQWDEWFEFKILEKVGQKLLVSIWDKDPAEDEFLGSCHIDISEVIKLGDLILTPQLQEVKHGSVNLHLKWYSLSTNLEDLNAASSELHQLNVPLSTSFLTVIVDSASGLPPVKSSVNPDPFIEVRLGHTKYVTKVKEKTTTPVWEEGFTFFLDNPNGASLQLKVFDSKTDHMLGTLTYAVVDLLKKKNLELTREPFKLPNGGEVVLSLSLRIFAAKETGKESDDETNDTESTVEAVTDEQKPSKPNQLSKQDSFMSNSSDISVAQSYVPGDGKIQITLRYSPPRQRLIIVVHKVVDIFYKNPDNLPNLYVKMYLLPEREKTSKRKTKIKKNTLSPEFDETFEYLVAQKELDTKQVEVSLVEDKVMKNPVLGKILIDLKNYDLSSSVTEWFNFGDQ
ncbi:extended synaptotagmin-2 isoform X2 [Aethina tumida]|uniref:extended synaptotagmin-2 isoform X2 n=1 Tax=Aethina tumida TaxID=116153 RepID=UPI00214845C4|nr:extended synaptotagmin-2 isoform X2 [Aethina tumida]